TIERRLQRRLVLHKLSRLDQYLAFLRDHPAEVQALYRDILIHVTHFFREPDAFETLRSEVIARLLDGRPADQTIRAWVAGCSTGEEAYSLAIVLFEVLGDQAGARPIQIFGTDIAEEAIQRARDGFYPEAISAEVSAERLRRFFTRTDGGYR